MALEVDRGRASGTTSGPLLSLLNTATERPTDLFMAVVYSLVMSATCTPNDHPRVRSPVAQAYHYPMPYGGTRRVKILLGKINLRRIVVDFGAICTMVKDGTDQHLCVLKGRLKDGRKEKGRRWCCPMLIQQQGRTIAVDAWYTSTFTRTRMASPHLVRLDALLWKHAWKICPV